MYATGDREKILILDSMAIYRSRGRVAW